MKVNTKTLDQLWEGWQIAVAARAWDEAREYREMYLGLLANAGTASHIRKTQ